VRPELLSTAAAKRMLLKNHPRGAAVNRGLREKDLAHD
jgi:hypothetical protein